MKYSQVLKELKNLKEIESVCKLWMYLIFALTIYHIESANNKWNNIEIVGIIWNAMTYSEDIEYKKKIWNNLTLAI